MSQHIVDLAKLQAEIRQKEKELEELRVVEGWLKSHSQPLEEKKETQPSASEWERITVHEAAEKVLREKGEPMRTADITTALEKRGFGKNLANLQNAVFTALARKEDIFRKIEKGVWSLVEWPESPRMQGFFSEKETDDPRGAGIAG